MKKTLNVGDTVWIASYPMLDYKVIAEIKREKNVQYEIECMHCNHSDNCRVLIGYDDYGKLVYIGMVNEDEDSDDRQYYFHKDGVYKKTKDEAYIYRIEKYIQTELSEIEKKKKGIEYNEEQIKKLKEQLEMHKSALKTPLK